MSDEVKVIHEDGHKCLCQNESFRKFVVIAAGSFVGVFCALSLFAALHKPPMIFNPYAIHGFGGAMQPCPCRMMPHHMKFEKHIKDDIKKELPRGMNRPSPFEKNKVEVDD